MCDRNLAANIKTTVVGFLALAGTGAGGIGFRRLIDDRICRRRLVGHRAGYAACFFCCAANGLISFFAAQRTVIFGVGFAGGLAFAGIDIGMYFNREIAGPRNGRQQRDDRLTIALFHLHLQLEHPVVSTGLIR